MFPFLVLTFSLLLTACETGTETKTPAPIPAAVLASGSPSPVATPSHTAAAPARPTMTPILTPITLAMPAPPTLTPGALACLKPGDLAPYWPPHGTVRSPDGVIDVEPISFDQVRVLEIVCGNVRSSGQDAYIAYQLPPPSPAPEMFWPAVLAALHRAQGSLINLGVLPWGDNPSIRILDLQDATGDGRPEIIFVAGRGAKTTGFFTIWGWEAGRYRELFRDYSEPGPLFKDLDGDGRVEMVLRERVGSGAASFMWDTAYRWNGQTFRPVLVPVLYDDFIARHQGFIPYLLERGMAPNEEVILQVVLLGHAYELQGRTVAAEAEYALAWALHEAIAGNVRCEGAARAVQEFYLALEGRKLPEAFSMLGEALRQARPFPGFAAGYARTHDIQLMEKPQVMSKEDDVAHVAVRVRAADLTPEGEVEQRFSGSWRVRLEGHSCILESADIRRE